MSISTNNNLTQMKEYKANACNFLDYMHFFMPNLIFDINKLTPYLSSSVSEDIKAIHITSVYATLKYTEDNRKRKGKYTREECYKKYCEFLENNIPPLEKSLFKTAFDSLSYINLDSNYLDCSEKSREAIELWKNSGETDDSIIKLLSVIANKHPNLAMKRLHHRQERLRILIFILFNLIFSVL